MKKNIIKKKKNLTDDDKLKFPTKINYQQL